ncbi:hypothetical protein B0I37DRAFT_411940 [Chaetomium sp. MPI-CAGE-AT-0009]|nr:hypothetical protein B0I37DRAFT_411940 [Chaetomium sp. MPI-CAGE-AT-0009]
MSNSTTEPTNRTTQPRTARGDAMADLAASLLSSPHKQPHHPQPTTTTTAAAQDTMDDISTHAMSHTGAWKPALDRRQSWSAQEYKHDLFKRQYMGGSAEKEDGGFSEV